jgi:phospholipase/lecithinase/hemolysin
MVKTLSASVFAALVLVIIAPDARADKIKNLVVFGDSLSDTGNINSRTFGQYLTPPKYTAGRFTDGGDTKPAAMGQNYKIQGGYNVIWHEQLARMLGIPAASASLIAGNKQNYAFGGAETFGGTTVVAKGTKIGDISADNMGQQVSDFLAKNSFPDKALYILWGGGNDLRDVFFHSYDDNLNDFTDITRQNVLDAAKNAVKNITDEITSLITAKGSTATNFLWPDLPPLDQTPRFMTIDKMNVDDGSEVGDDVKDAVKLFKDDEEAAISALQTKFAAKGVKIVELDVYTQVNNIIANPKKYNYTNVTGTAQSLAVGANPDGYLFWDGFHPTSHGHYDIATLARQDLQNAGLVCPEPSGIAMAITGAVAAALWWLCSYRRKLRQLGPGPSLTR